MRLIDADETIRKIMDEMQRLLEQQSQFTGKSIEMVNNIRKTIYGLAKAVDILHEEPTIEERKKGQWEEREVSSDNVIDEWQSARCSVCGKYHTTPYMYYFDKFSFCPNCGSYNGGENDGK